MSSTLHGVVFHFSHRPSECRECAGGQIRTNAAADSILKKGLGPGAPQRSARHPAERLTVLVVVAGIAVVRDGLASRKHRLKAAPGVAQVVAVGVGHWLTCAQVQMKDFG
jgi:hypothetical protein